jgi:hypothetical protein
MTATGFSFARTHDDPEAEIAAHVLSRLLRERQPGRHQEWQEKNASYPPDWRAAAQDNAWVSYLTAEELRQLNQDLVAVLQSRFPERLRDPSRRPPGAALVEVLLLSHPLNLPACSPTAGQDDPAAPESGR